MNTTNTTNTMSDRQYFFRTFKYVKPYTVMYVIGIFLYSAQAFGNAFIMGQFLERVMYGILNLDTSIVFNAIWFLAVMMLVFMAVVGTGTFAYVNSLALANRDFSRHLFRAFMKSSIENEKHSGEGIAAINTDVTTASDIFSNALSPFLNNLIAISFSGVVVFIIDWRLGLGAVAVSGLILLIQTRFAAPLARLGKEQLQTNAESVKEVSNIFAGALTIRAFGRQDRALFSFDRENGKLRKLAFRRAFLGMWQDLFSTFEGWMSLALVFALGGWLVARGELNLAQIMGIYPLIGTMTQSTSQLGTTFSALQPPIVAAKRVFDIIDAVPDLDKPAPKSDEEWDGNYTITLDNLDFAYKNAHTNALSEIDLTIEEKQMIAFVGESGSGKSTLQRLLIGMYEREYLNMKIGNIPFTAGNLSEWRKHFAYVDQTCKLFDMSIAENIKMGKPATAEQLREGKPDYATDEDVQEAARRAFAHDFISDLPEGYDTACGEKGASLSGGQKQRLAIARALCRKAQILVFDEATSALDPDSERHIMQTIESFRQDHTILITTHNLHNIKTADKIVVMDQGKIAEIGNHDELLALGGIYARLLEEQR